MTPRATEQQQKCPVCDHPETLIVEHRGIRRRRECQQCHHRWTTYEISAARLDELEAIERHAAAIAEVMSDRIKVPT